MKEKKILLALLPFWEPRIPPLGITSLKTFLREHGYTVKTVDANIREEFREIHRRYFGLLEECIPVGKRGNFFNVGADVLRNHLLAHLHYEDEGAYIRLCGDIVYKTFYTRLEEPRLRALADTLRDFYRVLGTYVTGLLDEEKPDLLGLSVYRGNLAPSMFALRLTREYAPHVETVMGGAVFAGELAVGSENLESFLDRTPYIDRIFAGEGELLFLKYLEGELPLSQRVYTLTDIGGSTLDLGDDAVKTPDFSDFDLPFYPSLAVYASRSCPFQCSFCTETVYWGRYRKKEPGRVVEEMNALYGRHGSQLFLMCDSLLNPVITPLSEAVIGSGGSFYWDGYLRVAPEVCDVDYTFLWRRGGFYRARLGIESGSPHVLGLMGKRITVPQIKSALAGLAEAGIKTTTYWIIGHPGETESDFQQTLELIGEVRDDIYEAWCSPFNYYKTSQVDSGRWVDRSRLLYPSGAGEMLVVQTWILEGVPSREETYGRMNRFIERCGCLGVPTPYSMVEFYRADERWKGLHKNAVPSLVEFENRDNYIDESRNIKRSIAARKKLAGDMSFDF